MMSHPATHEPIIRVMTEQEGDGSATSHSQLGPTCQFLSVTSQLGHHHRYYEGSTVEQLLDEALDAQ